jgi:nicotinamidase/pyrazinamidase
MKKIIAFDVDTQKDFILSDGALYIKGADAIIPKLLFLSDLFQHKKIMIIGSVDCHKHSDKELQRNGGMFPDHCMEGTEGQMKVLMNGGTFFAKRSTDAFSNPMLESFLKIWQVGIAFVFGVATDYCVREAVLGLLKRGIEVYVVKDAIAAVDSLAGEQAIHEMEAHGAIFIDSSKIGELLK